MYQQICPLHHHVLKLYFQTCNEHGVPVTQQQWEQYIAHTLIPQGVMAHQVNQTTDDSPALTAIRKVVTILTTEEVPYFLA